MLAGRIEPSQSIQPEVVEGPAVTSPRDRNSARATELRSDLTDIMRRLGSH